MNSRLEKSNQIVQNSRWLQGFHQDCPAPHYSAALLPGRRLQMPDGKKITDSGQDLFLPIRLAVWIERKNFFVCFLPILLAAGSPTSCFMNAARFPNWWPTIWASAIL